MKIRNNDDDDEDDDDDDDWIKMEDQDLLNLD